MLLRETINKKEITKINWIENKYQIEDCLTKYGASSEKLLSKPYQLNLLMKYCININKKILRIIIMQSINQYFFNYK